MTPNHIGESRRLPPVVWACITLGALALVLLIINLTTRNWVAAGAMACLIASLTISGTVYARAATKD